MNNFITYEQAAKLGNLAQVAEQYQSKVNEVVRYFMSNTAAQMFCSSTYLDAIEFQSAMRNKDYSNFLFEKINEMYTKFKEDEPDLDNLKKNCIKIAQLNSGL